MATSFEPLPGLREPFLFAGASSRARIDDVASPRCAGFTRQDTYRQYSWQIPSKNAALAFYTISAEAHDVVKSHSDVACSCSCPFKGPGWCKHIVRCLYSIVDRAAAEASTVAPSAPSPPPEDAPRKPQTPPSSSRKRRRVAARTLRCARCSAEFPEGGGGGGCERRHPSSMVSGGTCRRCGRAASTPLCFTGAHCASLADVDREGWPSDDDDDDDD